MIQNRRDGKRSGAEDISAEGSGAQDTATSSAREARIGGLLLAAGSSTRMGDNKMLMEINGETLLRRAAGTALAAHLDPLIVVTGYQREEAAGQVADLRCDTVFNPDHATGIHTSVRAGVDALPEDVAAVVIMLADMPFVTEAMLTDLQRGYRASAAPLVISRYGDEVKAPPMLYDRSLFAELRVMQRRCGREVVKRHLDEAAVRDWPIEALADIDTPEDYERVCATIAGADDDD
jgi:molybdenum cofactor cytidylyltransferase